MQTRSVYTRPSSAPAAAPASRAVASGCCPYCGKARDTVIKRGAITVTSDPTEVFWHGMLVPLSPTEAHVFRAIAVRGRASNAMIDDALTAFGSSPATRPVVMMRIRRKFMALGSEDPFIRLGHHGVRINVAADFQGSSATMIGLSMEAQPVG